MHATNISFKLSRVISLKVRGVFCEIGYCAENKKNGF